MTPTLAEASMAARDLDGVMGFEPPSWDALLRGVHPPSQEWDQQEPACFQRGWQHEASSRVERHHREVNVFPRLPESGRALVRSQAGPLGGLALAACPTCRITIWILTCSECCCSVVSNCLFLLPCVPAGVAISSMLMAITAQRALELGYWPEGDFRWRVSRRGSVGRQVASYHQHSGARSRS